MKVQVLPSAKADLQRGMAFYEGQSAGLGEYFFESISADLDTLESTAGIQPRLGSHHRYLCTRFPFWIYYRVENQTAYIAAILDTRQDPEKILNRLKQEREGEED